MVREDATRVGPTGYPKGKGTNNSFIVLNFFAETFLTAPPREWDEVERGSDRERGEGAFAIPKIPRPHQVLLQSGGGVCTWRLV